MNILFTICARAGSKGVKSKNARDFLGYPILYYTLSAYDGFCRGYGYKYGEIALALNTDSVQVLEQCQKSGICFEYVAREEALGGDSIAKADVIKDTLLKIEARKMIRYDVIVDLDLTSPLRTVKDIKGCLDSLLDSDGTKVAYSVTHARRTPYFNMVKKNAEGFMERVIKSNFLTRQEAPECFDMNASIYAYKRDALLENYQNSIFDEGAVAWLMKDTAVLDIDSEEDYELMQVIGEYLFSRYEEFRWVRENIKK